VGGSLPTSGAGVMGTTSAFLDLAFGPGPAAMGFVAASIGRPGTFLVGGTVAAIGLAVATAMRLGRARPTA
jgi:hypothetical protein